ncbi:SEN1 N terminal-domain-containing protein [Xylariaceae sp. FL1272]|nr:SEN1 N terminal-domain-containing protein [Xylariaceae sp. FL1272]
MADVTNILQVAFDKLEGIPDGCHLFCPKVSFDDEEVYDSPDVATEGLTKEEKVQRIKDGRVRLDSMYHCSLILGLDRENAGELRNRFDTMCDTYLRTCSECARNWHKGRKQFLKEMGEFYDDSVVDELSNRIDQFDFERINQGLAAAEAFIHERDGTSVSQTTFIKEGKAELLIALYEALCSMAFLDLPENIPAFNFVFQTIQARRTLRLDEILPTMTHFLLDNNKDENSENRNSENQNPEIRKHFAEQAFKRPNITITKETFDWAINQSLEKAILNANSLKTDADSLVRFWEGLKLIIDAIDADVLAECLRGMTIQPSIYDLMISQMPHIRSNDFKVLSAVLRVFCTLVKKSPNTLWSAFSQWSRPAVLEQIIRSPAFRPLLSQSGEHDMTPDGPVAIAWVRPCIESITANQKTDVCDKLIHHLLGKDLANSIEMSPEGKFACYRGVTEALSSTLAAFVAPKFRLTGATIIQATTILNITLKYKDLIIELAQLRGSDLHQKSMAKASLAVIGSALALDSRITAEECNIIMGDEKQVQREVKRDSPGLWEAFLEVLQPGAYDLAAAMLVAFQPLITIEIFRPARKETVSKVKREFNAEFQRTLEMIGRMIERLEDFDQNAMGRLCLEPTTMYSLVAGLVHGEDIVSQASASFIKALTKQERRTDAVQGLLEMHLVPVLSAFIRVVDDITDRKALWAPQFNILRYSREILDSLCSPTSGVLRGRVLNSTEREVLTTWWRSQWTFLDNCFDQTEGWSRMDLNLDTMKNFCRDAMEHADALLSQDELLALSLSSGQKQTPQGIDAVASLESMKSILDQPRRNCMGLCKMLRLKDLYLVDINVNVVLKLLKRLHRYALDMPGQPIAFIKNACTRTPDNRYRTATNLNSRQRAELSKALGEEADTTDDLEILEDRKVDAPKKQKQTKLDEWSKSSSSETASVASKETPVSAPVPKSSKDDIRELLKHSTSDKSRSILSEMSARTPASKTKPPAPAPALSSVTSIREKRAKEAEEKRLRNAAAIAKAQALRTGRPTVVGEGSGLQGLSGVHGKEHAPAQKSEMMVNSSSEDEEDSEDDDESDFLARTGTLRKPADDAKNRIGSMKIAPRGPVKKMKIQRSAKDMRARLIPPMDILHQAILEWDIFHEGHDPPNGIMCSKVADSYNDPRQYKETFLPLLINEAWRSFVTSKDEITAKPFETKIIARMNIDKFIEVSTSMPKAETKDRFLSEGDIVLFSHAPNPLAAKDELHCLARIWRIQFKGAHLEVQYRLSNKAGPILGTLMPQSEVYAIKITNMTTIEREYASLESLQYYDLAPEILEAKPSPMLSFSNEALEKAMSNYHLNQGQAKAVLHAKENDAFTLVQGPPGTGKTKTIIAMVGALLAGSPVATGTAIKRPGGAPPVTKGTSKKLLVCAPSNAAVDELVVRLKEGVKSMSGTFNKINVLRLGRSEAINAAVRDVTLDELVKARVEASAKENSGPSARELIHQEAGAIKIALNDLRPQLESARERGDREETNRLQRQFDEHKRRQAQIGAKIDADKESGSHQVRDSEIKRRQYQQEILDSAQVLCATLSGSGHEMFKNLNVEFETVIIDEAAQCVELSALIPLKYGCSKCVLVGDPKQLPPTVLSQSAARYGYDQSLFVRMQRNSPQDIHLLDTQYRMHPEISSFPSLEFYERLLVDGDNMAKLRQKPWHRSELLGPYRFFDVKGIQEKGRRGQSLVNFEELKVAMQLYERFKVDYPMVDIKGKVGIITPYKAQLFELRDQFSRRYGPQITEDIEFNTTDAFQGRECEIIIFSCVRASSTGGIGFMTDIRRMNVGLTRAKSSLWVLGDSRALVQGEFWNKLIIDAKARDRYTSGDVLSLLKKPGDKSFPSEPLALMPAAQPARDGHTTAQAANPYSHSINIRPGEDVIMEEAPPPEPRIPNKQPTYQMPQSYTVVGPAHGARPMSREASGINERGEAVAYSGSTSQRPVIHTSGSTSQRPVIHTAGAKRPREDGDRGHGNAAKKAKEAIPGLVAPSRPRQMPRPQDPAAMAALGIPPPSGSVSSRPPTNAPKGPSGSQRPSGPQHPAGPQQPKSRVIAPKRKPPPQADPLIRRKPNKPR